MPAASGGSFDEAGPREIFSAGAVAPRATDPRKNTQTVGNGRINEPHFENGRNAILAASNLALEAPRAVVAGQSKLRMEIAEFNRQTAALIDVYQAPALHVPTLM